MAEIELCPDCYWNSCVRKNDEWFTELCVGIAVLSQDKLYPCTDYYTLISKVWGI